MRRHWRTPRERRPCHAGRYRSCSPPPGRDQRYVRPVAGPSIAPLRQQQAVVSECRTPSSSPSPRSAAPRPVLRLGRHLLRRARSCGRIVVRSFPRGSPFTPPFPPPRSARRRAVENTRRVCGVAVAERVGVDDVTAVKSMGGAGRPRPPVRRSKLGVSLATGLGEPAHEALW